MYPPKTEAAGWVNRRITTVAGSVVAALIIGLDAHLLDARLLLEPATG